MCVLVGEGAEREKEGDMSLSESLSIHPKGHPTSVLLGYVST